MKDISNEYVIQAKEEIAINICENISTLSTLSEENITGIIADLCGVQRNAVYNWLKGNEKANVVASHYLRIIAEHYGVTIDWLISDHTADSAYIYDEQGDESEVIGVSFAHADSQTYGQAFLSLLPLLESRNIVPSEIRNVVLRGLSEEYVEKFEKLGQDVNVEKKSKFKSEYNIFRQWVVKIVNRFNIPIDTYDPGKFTLQDILTMKPELKGETDEDTYYNVALFLNENFFMAGDYSDSEEDPDNAKPIHVTESQINRYFDEENKIKKRRVELKPPHDFGKSSPSSGDKKQMIDDESTDDQSK